MKYNIRNFFVVFFLAMSEFPVKAFYSRLLLTSSNSTFFENIYRPLCNIDGLIVAYELKITEVSHVLKD